MKVLTADPNKSRAEITKDYDQRQRDRGLFRVSIYVPVNKKEELRRIVAKWVDAMPPSG